MTKFKRCAILITERATGRPVFAWHAPFIPWAEGVALASQSMHLMVRGLALAHGLPEPKLDGDAFVVKPLETEHAIKLQINAESWVAGAAIYALAGVTPGARPKLETDAGDMLETTYAEIFAANDGAARLGIAIKLDRPSPGHLAWFPDAIDLIRIQESVSEPGAIDPKVGSPRREGLLDAEPVHAITGIACALADVEWGRSKDEAYALDVPASKTLAAGAVAAMKRRFGAKVAEHWTILRRVSGEEPWPETTSGQGSERSSDLIKG